MERDNLRLCATGSSLYFAVDKWFTGFVERLMRRSFLYTRTVAVYDAETWMSTIAYDYEDENDVFVALIIIHAYQNGDDIETLFFLPD